MQVKLLNNPTLEFSDSAIGLCYDKGPYADPVKRDKRITKVALKHKHSSTIEFTNFVFDITATTKVLLEMTRHRHANYACKSTRYTLNKGDIVFEPTGDAAIDELLEGWRQSIKSMIYQKKSNELTSLMLPQAYQYRWQVQFNARSLMNFFDLRRSSSAHFQIRDVANAMYNVVPDDMKYLFDPVSDDETGDNNEQHD